LLLGTIYYMSKNLSEWADWLRSYGLEIYIKKKYILALYKRLYLIRKDYCLKSEYEKNEVEIMELVTKNTIIKTSSIVAQMQFYYDGELSIYMEMLDNNIQNKTN